MRRREQTSLDVGRCGHLRTEPVLSYGGDIIAHRCLGCTLITSHHGVCDGCAQEGKLQCLVPSRGLRFCQVECYTRWQARNRKEKAAEEAALRAAIPDDVSR